MEKVIGGVYLQLGYIFDYGGLIVFDSENGKYVSHIQQISYNKYSSPSLLDIDNDGRDEITFTVKAWDETQETN